MSISSITNTTVNNQLQLHTSTSRDKTEPKTASTDIGPAAVLELSSKNISTKPVTYSRPS